MVKRKNGEKSFYWGGRKVSKSTFFRRQRAEKDTSLAASRDRITAEIADAPGAVDTAATPVVPSTNGLFSEAIERALTRERVQAFMLFARDKAGPMTDTIVNVAMPAKVFRAAVVALEKSGY